MGPLLRMYCYTHINTFLTEMTFPGKHPLESALMRLLNYVESILSVT